MCRETRYVAGVTQPGSVAHMVFHGRRLSGVSKLLEEARKCRRDWRDMTQLIRAARNKDSERVRQLFRLGCPTAVVNVQNADDSWTALHYASGRGHEAVVRELLAHVNVKDNEGWTPLLYASLCGRLADVRLLCDAPGIDLAARYGGQTALWFSVRHKSADIAAFLRSRVVPE